MHLKQVSKLVLVRPWQLEMSLTETKAALIIIFNITIIK